MASIILILGLVCNIAIGLFVYARNPKSKLNRSVLALALSFMVWQIANFLADKTSPLTLFWNRATFVGPLLILLSANFFLVYIQKKPVPWKYFLRVLLPVSAFCLCLAFTPYVITSVEPRMVNGAVSGYNVIRGWGYVLVIAWIVFLLGRFVINIARAYHKAEGELKGQLRIVMQGIVLGILVGICTNVLGPLLTDNTFLAKLAPISSVIVMGAFAVAIVKRKLFDIRFIVVRSIAYVTTILVMAVTFGVVVFGSLRLVVDVSLSLGAQVYISVATALAALIFSNLKSFFDRISNSLFYRDAYNSETLFDELNQILVANTDLDQLLRRTAKLIEQNMKAEFCLFGIREMDGRGLRLMGVGSTVLREEDFLSLEKLASHLNHRVIVSDDLEHEQFGTLQDTLQRQSIALMGQLTTSVHGSTERMGYMILGARRSGNPYTRQDIRTLEIIVNELVIAVENSLRFEQIQHFNETLQGKVDEATRKLRQTNEKLQGLDATKDEFITMASHQLRTPLTAVKGYLSMVLEGDAGKLNANQRRLLEQSYTSAQRMVYLIADLLNLSRLGTGKFVIEPTPTNLVDVVQTEIDQLEQTAASREVHLTFEHPESFSEIMLDETKIHQVVMNFIDNAIYYTPPGGRVTVSLSETPGSIVYAVHDTGIGVPRREQRHLFTKFYRAENARQARPDGTGLGLFMAKKVVAAQGGAIIFESEEGKGSTFGFRFNKRTHAVPSIKEQVASSK